MRSRIFLKLTGYDLLLVVVATVIIDFSIRRTWENFLRHTIQISLTEKAKLFADQVQDVSNPDLPNLVFRAATSADARVTVIETSGKVLADSEANPQTMENHATRPEFKQALQNQTGSDSRQSHTLGIEFLYVAVPVKNGAVRLAYPLSAIRTAVAEGRSRLLQASALALLLSIVLAAVAAQSISRRLKRIMVFAERIAEGDLSARIADSSFDEIAQVAIALDKTAHYLQDTFTALEHSRKELETLLNSMQEAVIDVSHELRTPLTSIQGYTETLLDSTAGANGNSHEFLEIIKKNAARMSRLTEDLLTLARVESGERKLELQPVAAEALLQDALRNFRKVAMEQGVDLAIERAVVREVLADADAIHQVFSNLIDNALKYAQTGKRI